LDMHDFFPVTSHHFQSVSIKSLVLDSFRIFLFLLNVIFNWFL
jgi:hypothetical protein